tara:strand:- start:358 stop:1728 length:1371 start_codon:yes stop_codon:yes gene_type:complete
MSFTHIWAVMDFGLQNAFYTFISAKIYHKNFYIFFLLGFLLQAFIPLIILFILIPQEALVGIFLLDERNIIFLAFLSIITQKNILLNITYLNESLRKSEVAQFFELFSIFSQFLLLIIFMQGDFDFLIQDMFLIIIFCNIVSSFFSSLFIKINFEETVMSFSGFIDEIFPYLKGLAFFVFLTSILNFVDIWFLSKFAGYVEQSYFQIASRFSMGFIILLAASSNIMWKETAVLKNSKEELLEFTSIFTNAFTFFAAFFCSILFFSTGNTSDFVISFFFGEDYLTSESIMTFRLVILNVFFHTYGALIVSSFYGIQKAFVSYLIQTFAMVFGFILVLILVGDSSISNLSLNLGASGLALKVLICSALFHSLGYIIFFKDLGFKAFVNLVKIYLQLIILMMLMFLLKFNLSYFYEDTSSYLFFITYNLIFTSIVLILVIYLPNIFGLKKISFYKNFLK